MASFDIAVGIAMNQVNSASIEIHRVAYPGPFQGSLNTTLPLLNIPVTASWDVKEPLHVQLPADLQDADLAVNLPDVVVGLSASGFPKTTLSLTTDLAADLAIDNGGKVSLEPKQVVVSSADLGTPLQTILDRLLLPAALTVFGPSLPTIQLPPLQVQGVGASPPKALTQSNYLIGVTVLANKGPSVPPPAGTSWPSQDIFVLLSDDALTAAATVALNDLSQTLHGSGNATVSGFGVEWHYDATLSNPHVTVVGQSLQIGLTVGGTAGAGLVLLGHSVDVPFNIVVEPNAGATAHFTIDSANTVTATIESLTPFDIVLTPSGNVPQLVTGAILAGIIDLIVGPLTLAITSLIKNISFAVFQVPNVPVTELGVSAIIRPHDLAISGFGGMLAVTGTVDIAHA